MKYIRESFTRNQMAIATASAFLIGTVMGKFILTFAFITLAVAGVIGGLYLLINKEK